MLTVTVWAPPVTGIVAGEKVAIAPAGRPVAAKVTRGSDLWRERAACRDGPGGDFFPDLYHYRGGLEIAAAKAICATCPVRKHCLSAGLNEAFGIWGGLTTEERRHLPRPGTQRVD